MRFSPQNQRHMFKSQSRRLADHLDHHSPLWLDDPRPPSGLLVIDTRLKPETIEEAVLENAKHDEIEFLKAVRDWR